MRTARGALAALAMVGGGCSALLDFEWGEDGGVVQADAAPLAADNLEPNDSWPAASSIGPATYPGLSIFPSSDVDFFRVTLGEPHDVTVQANFDPLAGDLDLYLYRWMPASGMLLEIANSTNFDMDEELTATMQAAGEYAIKVQSFGGGAANWYELVLTLN